MSDIEEERGRWLEVAVVAGLAAVPYAGGPISVVAQELLDRRRQRIAGLGANLLTDHDAKEILERLRTDERFGELFVRAAEATAISAWEPKRRAMGSVVRAALDDDAKVDDSELLLVALERLEAAHFAALQRVDHATRRLDEDKAGVKADEVPGLTPPVRAALLSVGAITQESAWGGLVYKSSDFGRRLLALVVM